MPAITVKNIPAGLYEILKRAAQLNHRSINSEIIACLERELVATQISASERVEKARVLRKRFKPTFRKGWFTCLILIRNTVHFLWTTSAQG